MDGLVFFFLLLFLFSFSYLSAVGVPKVQQLEAGQLEGPCVPLRPRPRLLPLWRLSVVSWSEETRKALITVFYRSFGGFVSKHQNFIYLLYGAVSSQVYERNKTPQTIVSEDAYSRPTVSGHWGEGGGGSILKFTRKQTHGYDLRSDLNLM